MDKKTKIVFIVNPISGTSDKSQIIDLIPEFLDGHRFDCSIRWTERKGHAAEFTDQAVREGAEVVVAVGGDGTVNEVARSLIHTNTALGIIPCGSGNGLARGLKIPLTPASAIKLLNQRNEHLIDSIVINDKYISVNAAGVGFDAYIARLMKAAKTRGFAAYTNLILREYASYKNNTYCLTIDGRTIERSAWFIAVANGRQFGYNLSVAPKANLSDGLIDISIIDKIPLDHILITAPMAFMNLLDHSQHVETFRAKDILIEGNVHKWVNIDGEGENLGNTLHFVNHPNSVKIFGRK